VRAKPPPHPTLPAAETAGLRSVRDWLRYATSLFLREKVAFGQGATTAFDEAVALLQHALHLPREGLETFLDAHLTPPEKRTLRTVLARRALAREPAAYITGEAWLGEFSFRVDRRVLIPRSYFLEIIPGQLAQWVPDLNAVTHAADICTGSGCLAILLAHTCPNARITATDLSADALQVAALNVADYRMEERIALHRADVLDSIEHPANGYDIIVCNPPYEPESVLDTLPDEFRQEPPMALVSGTDGMGVIRKLLPQAAAHLSPNGILLVETGGLHNALETAFPTLETHWLPTQDETDCIALFHATALRQCFTNGMKR
jgi:ribosomal protein L3 glutamine methyltransferase